jgi:hypothetical protein
MVAMDRRDSVRARLVDGVLRVELAEFDPSAINILDNAYQAIASRYDTIFPKFQRVEVLTKASRQGLPVREAKQVTLVLVGQLGNEDPKPPLEYGSEIDVINADHLSSYLRRGRPSSLFLILGRQSDWQQLVDTGNIIKDLSSLAVVFSTATEPLVSDFDIQRELQIPSVLMFALTRDFTRQPNSLRLVRPLIDIMSVKGSGRQDSFDLGRMPAKHCLMLREEIRPHYDPREVGSRIGARAIRAGIPVGARIDLFVDEQTSREVGIEWGRLFEPLFAVPYPSERTLQKRSHRPFLTMLADRTEQDSRFDSVREGVVRLLNLRGWHVERDDERLVISNENRQFSAIFVEKNQDAPAEDSISQRPAFGRSHLLVIHSSSNREALLIGNRGQYCHITLEDISLMQPDTQWIWSVLRRQLGTRTTKSLAALRLAASLAAEAIKMKRIEYSAARRGALDELVSILEADDCERFVNFMTRPSGRAEGFFMRIHVRSLAQDLPVDPELILRIEDDGPIVVIDW